MRTVNLCYLFLIFFLFFDVFFNSSILHSRGTLRVIQILFLFFPFLATIQNYPIYVQGIRNVQSERNTKWTFRANQSYHHTIRLYVWYKVRESYFNRCNFWAEMYKESLKRTNCLRLSFRKCEQVSMRMLHRASIARHAKIL